MNMHVSAAALAASAPHTAPDAELLIKTAHEAGRRIAPLWPLKDFVAVNPFFGLASHDAAEAQLMLAKAGGARLTHPLPFYAEALASGRISDADIAAMLDESAFGTHLPKSVAAFKSALAQARDMAPGALPTLADSASRLQGKDWAGFVTERISQWASQQFDEGQAPWRSNAAQSLFASWRSEALQDRTPDVMGLAGFRSALAALPADAEGLIVQATASLGLTAEEIGDYFHRLLFSLGGWASYARYLGWDKELDGQSHAGLTELLAIRLAWDSGIAAAFASDELLAAWRRDFAAARKLAHGEEAAAQRHLLLAAHHAYELATERALLGALPAGQAAKPTPRVQAVFCIDVRSEVMRRALEAQSPEIETLGFAGFFGASIAHVPLGETAAQAQVPVLLKPAFTVADQAATPAATLKLAEDAALTAKTAKGWKGLQQQAVSCFGFVEAAGLGFGFKLVTDSLGLTKRKPAPSLKPSLDAIPASSRLAMAENALRGMSLTRDFAPLVLLVGHGSESLNNPHASGLDCGACGGHSGEVNARVMAAVLNDPAVRFGLHAKGIEIPATTLFLGALHNTTTDAVTLFDTADLTGPCNADVRWIEAHLAAAGTAARAERAARLQGGVLGRARDFSQVRPEWGLAGCAAFIAAPRRFSAGKDLKGRAFLHSYNLAGRRGLQGARAHHDRTGRGRELDQPAVFRLDGRQPQLRQRQQGAAQRGGRLRRARGQFRPAALRASDAVGA